MYFDEVLPESEREKVRNLLGGFGPVQETSEPIDSEEMTVEEACELLNDTEGEALYDNRSKVMYVALDLINPRIRLLTKEQHRSLLQALYQRACYERDHGDGRSFFDRFSQLFYASFFEMMGLLPEDGRRIEDLEAWLAWSESLEEAENPKYRLLTAKIVFTAAFEYRKVGRTETYLRLYRRYILDYESIFWRAYHAPASDDGPKLFLDEDILFCSDNLLDTVSPIQSLL